MDESLIIDFGKYRGRHVENIPAQYLLSLLDNNYKLSNNILIYIVDNKESLKLKFVTQKFQ